MIYTHMLARVHACAREGTQEHTRVLFVCCDGAGFLSDVFFGDGEWRTSEL